MGRGKRPERPAKPDLVAGGFSLRRLKVAPAAVARAMSDLEVTRRPGTIPVLLAGDFVCLYADDFLGGDFGE